MKWKIRKMNNLKSRLLMLLTAGCITQIAVAQTPVITLDFTKPGANVSPMLYGLMTEEINHSYDGGLYGELVRNRIFQDSDKEAARWSLVGNGGDGGLAVA